MGRSQREIAREQDPRSVLSRIAVRAEVWRIIIPMLWLGMVGAISFIEAPLKFQAPGITIPLGLGIGRLVFAALNAAEALLLIGYTLVCLWPMQVRITGRRLAAWAALALVYLVKVFIVRPPLNARTDAVLAGAEPGQSPWHYVYMVCDLATMTLLVLAVWWAARELLLRTPEQPSLR